jgi:hypothetical protein
LAEHHSGDVLKLAPDLIDQRLARHNMRLAPDLPLGHQGFDPSGGCSNEPLRALVEAALPRFARIVPCAGNRLIVLGTGTEPAIDQP